MLGSLSDIPNAVHQRRHATDRIEVRASRAVQHAMTDSQVQSSPACGTHSPLTRLLSCWHNHDPDERYLAEATDHADLERRQRTLERTSTGPALVTSNH